MSVRRSPGPARVKDAGPPSEPFWATHKVKEALRAPPGTEGHCWRRMSASRVKGNEKMLAQCSHVVVQSGPSHVACFAARKKKSTACPPYFFASLKLLAVARTLTSRALSEEPQRLPQAPSISILFKQSLGYITALQPACNMDDLCSLPLRLRGWPTFRELGSRV